MRKNQIMLILALVVLSVAVVAFAKAKSDGNVYFVDEKGQKHFVCPVMGNQGVVSAKIEYSDYDGKRYYFCCEGCKPKFDAEPKKYVDAFNLPGNIIKVSGDKMTFICPVTGEEGVAAKDTKYTDYQGKRYYFCCPDCVGKFAKDQPGYLKSLEKKMTEACGDKGKEGCKGCAAPCKKAN